MPSDPSPRSTSDAPSLADPQVVAALDALGAARERFLSAVRVASGQIRALLDAQDAAGSDRAEVAAVELGGFAAARIDATRFSALLQERGPRLDSGALARLREANDTLLALTREGDALFTVDVDASADALEAIAAKLAAAGRAFSAARAAMKARAGQVDRRPSDSQVRGAGAIGPLSPREWNPPELGLAPPIVARLKGRARRLAGLGDLLGGRQKVVLFLDDATSAAPLARLVTPGTYVRQAAVGDVSAIADLAAWSGPGVVAFVGPDAARFTHDPRAGRTYADRLSVEFLPRVDTDAPDDLLHLRDLAAAGAAPVPAPELVPALAGAPIAPPAVDPLDRMAAWLITQSDLEGLT